MGEKTKIFINYRQIDCTALANSLGEVFRRRIGEEAFFLDRYAIDYGKSITEEILKLCRAAVHFNLVLLYGQSGAGKSSLLHAGVLPRLEASHTPVYLRRDKELGYHRQLTDALPGTAPAEQRPTLLILDQVEEM